MSTTARRGRQRGRLLITGGLIPRSHPAARISRGVGCFVHCSLRVLTPRRLGRTSHRTVHKSKSRSTGTARQEGCSRPPRDACETPPPCHQHPLSSDYGRRHRAGSPPGASFTAACPVGLAAGFRSRSPLESAPASPLECQPDCPVDSPSKSPLNSSPTSPSRAFSDLDSPWPVKPDPPPRTQSTRQELQHLRHDRIRRRVRKALVSALVIIVVVAAAGYGGYRLIERGSGNLTGAGGRGPSRRVPRPPSRPGAMTRRTWAASRLPPARACPPTQPRRPAQPRRPWLLKNSPCSPIPAEPPSASPFPTAPL